MTSNPIAEGELNEKLKAAAAGKEGRRERANKYRETYLLPRWVEIRLVFSKIETV